MNQLTVEQELEITKKAVLYLTNQVAGLSQENAFLKAQLDLTVQSSQEK